MKRQHRYAGMAVAMSGLLAWSGVGLAGDQRVGDWTWNIDDPELFVAGTENAAGHALAQVCDPSDGSCMYVVGFDIHCDPGHEYPVLVNSDAGSAQLEFVCGDRAGDQNLLVATDFEAIDDIVKSANKVGFAIPMQGDDFKAVRFSLVGSNEAIDAMREAAATFSRFEPGLKKRPAVERF